MILDQLNLRDGEIVSMDLRLNVNKSPNEQIPALQEDILQISYTKNYIIDMGWYPMMDPKGCIIIFLIKNYEWDNPLRKIKVHDLRKIIPELQNTIDLVAQLISND